MSSQTIFVTKGSTDYTVDVHLIQDAGATNPGDPLTGLVFNSAGLTCYYREGATGTVTQLALATQTVGGAHSDGGFVLLSDTLMPGSYRLDLSDTIVSGTNNQATVVLAGHADLAPHTVNIVLTDMDLYDAVRGGMTALPDANADAAGGLPISDTGGLNMDTIGSEVTGLDTKMDDLQGAGFVSATHSNEAIITTGNASWTGSEFTITSGTAQTGTTSSITLANGTTFGDGALIGARIHLDGGTGIGQTAAVDGWTDSTDVITIVGTWPGPTPDATTTYKIYPDAITEITDPPSAADIADAVHDENVTGHNLASTFGRIFSVDIPAILGDTQVIGAPVGASISADIAAVTTDVGTAQADLDTITGSDGVTLATAQANYAPAVAGDAMSLSAAGVDLIFDETMAGHTTADTAGLVLNEWQDAGRLDNLLDTAASVATEVGTAGAGLTDIGGFSTGALAEINTEVLDVLDVDTRAEPGQGSPGATITLAAKIDYIYKGWRNRYTSTATGVNIYDAGGTVIDHKAGHTDDATTYDRATMTAGP